MKLVAYSMRDMKADIFQAPFFVANEITARRLLTQLVQNRESTLGQYPQDFQMYRVGAFNPETGELSAEMPTAICSALSAIPKPDPRQVMIPGTEVAPQEVPA